MNKLSKIVIIIIANVLISTNCYSNNNEVSATAMFRAILGKTLTVSQDGSQGELGIVIPGSSKDLSDIPIELKSASFVLSGEALSGFSANGFVQTNSEGMTLSGIVWEYFNYDTNEWEVISTTDTGFFDSSQTNMKLNENGQALIRVYPNNIAADDDSTGDSETDIYFQVTLSCNYTSI